MVIPGGQATLPARMAVAAGVGGGEAGLQPVYGEGDFASQKATQIGTGAAMGAGATYGLDKLAGIMPKNLMTKFYKRPQSGSEKAANIAEADVLEEMTGISMTPAEKAGSRGIQMLENLARQSIVSADNLAAYDKKVARHQRHFLRPAAIQRLQFQHLFLALIFHAITY